MDEPLLELDLAPDEYDELEWDIDAEGAIASNDEWAFKKADRLVNNLPRPVGRGDRRTEGEVFDKKTLMTLHKFLSSGVLRSLDFPVSTGKEANVFRGTTPAGHFVAVKIFRTNTATFKHVLKYIQGDDRFQGISKDKRTLTYAWAQKEFRNLHRCRDAGVSVPEPIKVLNNVLVMEYLGTEEGTWPKLKEMKRLDNPEKMYKIITQDYVDITNKAGLVHGDCSEYNILVAEPGSKKNEVPRVIDVGQGVLRNHPMSVEFMRRDIKNITSFFKRQGLKVTDDELLQRIDMEPFQ
jgi:RIO kinase 1